jgi:hypothetical protein
MSDIASVGHTLEDWMQIEIDFDVFKEITLRRQDEGTSPNDVLREVFKLGKKKARAAPAAGVHYKGVFFPEGTEFRGAFKGKTYKTLIKNSTFQDEAGTEYSSPSKAAYELAGSTLNGWLFWECKRPGETEWKVIDKLRGKRAA